MSKSSSVTIQDDHTLEKIVAQWVLLLTPCVIIPYLFGWFDGEEKYDPKAFVLLYANLASYVAFRVFAYPKARGITRLDIVTSRATQAGLEVVDCSKVPKPTVSALMRNAHLVKFSRAKVLEDITEHELSVIEHHWLIALLALVFGIIAFFVFGFGDLLKPLTPEKAMAFSASLTFVVLYFWWPLFEARMRNKQE